MSQLTSCKFCGRHVSVSARECPHCRNPPWGFRCSFCHRDFSPGELTQREPQVPGTVPPLQCRACAAKARAQREAIAQVKRSHRFNCPVCGEEVDPTSGRPCPSCGDPLIHSVERCRYCRLQVKKGGANVKRYAGGGHPYSSMPDRYAHAECAALHPEDKPTGLCFIATAVYGETSPEVATLHIFRDSILRQSRLGCLFVAIYELLSPPVAVAIAQRPALRFLARWLIVAPAYSIARRVLGRCA